MSEARKGWNTHSGLGRVPIQVEKFMCHGVHESRRQEQETDRWIICMDVTKVPVVVR